MYDFYTGEVLLIDKPYGWSSFQAVNKLKHAIKSHPSLSVNGVRIKPKIGHAGTLDPLATGLLIVCTGKMTKQIESFMGQEKEYTGTFFMGATTPCYDMEKPVDRTYPVEHLTDAILQDAAQAMTGLQQQVPPVFSAIMIGGKRAYELARQGEEVEMKSREIDIRVFEITRIALPEVNFRIVCSKGTYIRSIARDFGFAVGSGAYLSALRRTRIGNYPVSGAVSPVEFSEKLRAEI